MNKEWHLHLTYGVPEPIDIDVGTERAAIHLSPMADGRGRHVIKIFDNTGVDRNQYVGSVRLEPDPIAAAVQDETERCKMVNLQHLAVEVATLVNNALDAPPEPVSEYAHGQGDMYGRMLSLVRSWIPSGGEGLTGYACTKMLENLETTFVLTEPPDAK